MFSVQLANISTRCSDPYVLLSVHQSSTTGSKCDDVITMSLHVVEKWLIGQNDSQTEGDMDHSPSGREHPSYTLVYFGWM